MTKTTGNFTDFLDFTRNSGGTCLRRIAYGSELVTNGTFDTDTTGWTTNGDVSVSSGQVTVENDTAVISDIRQTVSVTAGKIYAISFNFADRANAANIRVSIDADQYLYTGGLLAQNITAKGFYSLTFLATGSNAYIRLMTNAISIGHSTTWDNISVKEVILDAPYGDLVLFNHPNNVPRVEYDTNGDVRGLLIEEARTNLVKVSEVTAEDNIGWSNSSATPTDLNENALGVFKGVSIASSGQNWHRRSIEITSVTSGSDYTATVFYRAGTSNRLRVTFRDNSGGAVESRVTGEIGSLSVTQELAGPLEILSNEDLPDNVKKITIKYTPNFTGSLLFGIGPDSNTSGETVIAYAAQVEAGPFATSYIPTTGATATRGNELCSIDVDNFGWHGGEAGSGTVVLEAQSDNWQHEGSSQFFRVLEFDGHINNGIYRAASDGDGDQIRYRLSDSSDGGAFGPANIGAATASITDGAKVALAYAPDDFAIAANGASPTTDSSGTFDTLAVTTISIGKSTGNSNYLNGYLKSFQYYPRRLTNAQLQELTS